jgi:glycosyltransferase involved in cell wall biosynthesis
MHVLIVGEGEERAGLEALVAKTPSLFGRVHFAGYVADPRDHYRAMGVYCLSSDTEQMPVALLEAMASGLAVVSTDVGDVRAILPDEQSPYVVPIEERESAWPIAEKLTVLVAGSRERERLGALNRARVHERFTFEGMLAAYLDVYHGGLAA